LILEREKRIFTVRITITNKEFLNDPEGETVLNDLILKENYKDVLSVRSAKSLTIKILAFDDKDATNKIKLMCDDLRIYNSIVSSCEISIIKD
jgi:phosphoribosylformylglycinamidine synthase subunit PurS